MRRAAVPSFVLTFVLALTGQSAAADATGADAPPRRARAETWDAWGEARLRALASTPMVYDDARRPLDPGTWLMSRVVAGARYAASPRLALELEVEGLSGFLAGDATSLGLTTGSHPFPVARDGPADLARALPRKALVAWTTDVGLLTVGVQTTRWGTGMLVNDGAGDEPFGDGWLGNVALRAAFASRPLERTSAPALVRKLAVFVAGDYVLRDDNASLYDGDQAVAGSVGVRAQDGGDVLGVLASVRRQVDREDALRPDHQRTATTAFVLDGHGRIVWPVARRQHLALEGEIATVLGSSTRPWSDATWQTGASLAQLGAVARVRWDHDAARVTTTLELGYASGDDDPRDTVARTFTMHTDHNVGLVLFDEVLPRLTARGADRLADPSLVAIAPPGLRFAINPGAVQNAAYATLVARVRPLRPLDVRVGVLFAVPAGYLLDAYQTALHGGYATSAGGVVHSLGAYGDEIDARATYDVPLSAVTTLRAGVEGGVLFPGPAFAGVAGVRPSDGEARPLGLGRLIASLFW